MVVKHSAVEKLQEQVTQLVMEVTKLRAENLELRAELRKAQTRIAELESENARLKAELQRLKQEPFQPRRRRKSQRKTNSTPSGNRPGRKAGHAGSGRKRPERIDTEERVEVPRLRE